MKTLQRKARHGTMGGFSLMETVVSMAVVSIGLLGFCSAILEGMVLSQMNEEAGAARRAAKEIIADMESASFPLAWALFNASEEDDPAGEVALHGGFAVEGLDPVAGDPDGLVGEIIFSDDVDAVGKLVLREDLDMPELGTPLDLNLDGVKDALDHAGDYKVLPVLIRVTWRGRAGPASVTFRTVLIDQ